MVRLRYLFIVILSLLIQQAGGQKAGIILKNQLSSWAGLNFGSPVQSQAGIRYIPQLNPWWQPGGKSSFDAEISVNTWGNLDFTKLSLDTATGDLKPYRLWLRYSTNRFEIRAGLQKVNFGSASIIRPLMWFDKMDFRDPLQLTEGVYGLLSRYYFNNNANIWVWALYGNNNTKGWEAFPTAEEKPEYGGRLQLPFPRGEIAVSYHYRVADFSDLYVGIPLQEDPLYTENLIAFDGKWDIGIGLWTEFVAKLNDGDNQLLSEWENYFNVGFDYTFPWGSGLTLMSEFFHYSNRPEEGQPEVKRNLSAVVLNYPLSLSHSLSGMVYYNWDTEEWYRFLRLQLTYDHLSFHLMTYWNPDNFSLYGGNGNRSLFTGKGFQLMLVLDI